MKYYFKVNPEPFPSISIIDVFEHELYSELNAEFIQILKRNTPIPFINLMVKTDVDPIFKHIDLTANSIIIGYGNRFVIFDIQKKISLINLKFEGYFSSFRIIQDNIYVATDSQLINISLDGNIKWKRLNLGIDGVEINEITKDKIIGSGEWDPPGRWKTFIVNRKTGTKYDES